jgi:LmbE family N-acetylglucosaminyl deacetylase
MKTILVVAPHPDDETLGCGGTLLKHRAEGDPVHWVIMTRGGNESSRKKTIDSVTLRFGFASVEDLGFPSARLDSVPRSELVEKLGEAIRKIKPQVVYLPYPADVHTDHRVAFETAAACSKWFRYPSIERVLAYETPSETEMAIDPSFAPFTPNVFIDVGPYAKAKREILALYASELGEFPFPRSFGTVDALGAFRGSTAGYECAEAFMLLRERVGAR